MDYKATLKQIGYSELQARIMSDSQILELQGRLHTIYSLCIPRAILKPKGEVEIIWIDSESQKEEIARINQMIKDRAAEIEAHYESPD